jgi:hypothetical protein
VCQGVPAWAVHFGKWIWNRGRTCAGYGSCLVAKGLPGACNHTPASSRRPGGPNNRFTTALCGLQGQDFLPDELPRCFYCFPSSTLSVPTIASDGRAVSGAFAIIAAIFAALRHRALAARMRTFVGFFFGHDHLLASVSISTQLEPLTLQPRVPSGPSILLQHQTSPLRGFLLGILAVSRVRKREQKSPLG